MKKSALLCSFSWFFIDNSFKQLLFTIVVFFRVCGTWTRNMDVKYGLTNISVESNMNNAFYNINIKVME